MPEAQGTPNSQQPTSYKPQRFNWKNALLMFLIGATVIFAGVSTYYYFQLKSTQPTPQLKPPKTSSPSASPKPEQPTVTPDETADWKVYKNSVDGYTIKYPKSYKQTGPNLQANDANIYFKSNDYKTEGDQIISLVDGVIIYIRTVKNADYGIKTIDDWISLNKNLNLSNKRVVKIGGLEGVRYDFKSPHGAKLEIVVIVSESRTYEFWFEGSEEDRATGLDLFENMLSTFRFD